MLKLLYFCYHVFLVIVIVHFPIYYYFSFIRDGLFDGLKPDIITQIFDDLAKSAEKFGKALKNVADAGKSASAIKVMDKAIQYQKEIAKNANNRDALAEILKVSSGKGGSGEGMEIVLQIEDMKDQRLHHLLLTKSVELHLWNVFYQ